ncbi:MAG: hypothetical protein RL415_1440 [Actinomycetota bacterium]
MRVAHIRMAMRCADVVLIWHLMRLGDVQMSAPSSITARLTSAGHTVATPAEPASVRDGSAASVLSEAEAIINAMADDIAAEIKEKKNKRKKRKRK